MVRPLAIVSTNMPIAAVENRYVTDHVAGTTLNWSRITSQVDPQINETSRNGSNIRG
jgi:hypothetical protein